MFKLVDGADQTPVTPVIKVIGIGGGGGNAVQHMAENGIEGVEFICANTDLQALQNKTARTLQLGGKLTGGQGAGTKPDVGREAALEDRGRLQEALEGCDMAFIAAGMGGGTGTGAAPVLAQVAQEMGILTVAVVTRPFDFEGRAAVADKGIEELGHFVNSLITISNEKLKSVLGAEMTLLNAFAAANDVLLNAVQGIAEIITRPGLVNVDFADVRTVMSEKGMAMMGAGKAQGEGRAGAAAEAAIASPLLEDVNLSGAKGILVNVTAGMDLAIGEYDEIGARVKQLASDSATVVVGAVIDPELSGDIRVTIVATGLGDAPGKSDAQDASRVRLVQNARISADYRDFERPTALRNQTPEETPKDTRDPQGKPAEDAEYLSVPAFLRRQAD